MGTGARRIVQLFAMCALVSTGSLAQAQPVSDATRASARSLGEEGNDLFDKGDYAAALDRYDRAARLVNVPTLGLKAARCLERLGRLVEASEKYLAVSRMEVTADSLPVHREAVASADAERSALLPRVPALVIRVSGVREPSVTLDGRAVPAALLGVKQSVDPGPHRVEARGGGRSAARDVRLSERDTATVELDLQFSPSASSPDQRPVPAPTPDTSAPPVRTWLGVGALGLGAVGVGVGAVAGILAATQRSDVEGSCGTELRCPPAQRDLADSYNAKRTVSTIGFVAGGVLAAAGVILLVTAPSSKGSRRAQVLHGPRGPWARISIGAGHVGLGWR